MNSSEEFRLKERYMIFGRLLKLQDDNTLDFLLSVAKLINISGSEVMKAMTKLYGVLILGVLDSLPEWRRGIQVRNWIVGAVLTSDVQIYEPRWRRNIRDCLTVCSRLPLADSMPCTPLTYTQLKKTMKLSASQEQHLCLLLQIIAHKIKYDDQYNFQRYGEYEEDTNNYRKVLFLLANQLTLFRT